LLARGSGAAVEGHLMREGQRPRASHLARVSETLTVALCLLGLASPPASAADSIPAPDSSRPAASSPAGSETPRPDPAPQASGHARSLGPSTHITPSINAPLSTTRAPSGSSEVSVTTTAATQLPSSLVAQPRRVHETGAGGGIGGARGHVAHKRVPPSLAGTAVASLEPRQSDSRLLLFASLACALVMVSSLTLLRMLKRMGGSWSEGRTP